MWGREWYQPTRLVLLHDMACPDFQELASGRIFMTWTCLVPKVRFPLCSRSLCKYLEPFRRTCDLGLWICYSTSVCGHFKTFLSPLAHLGEKWPPPPECPISVPGPKVGVDAFGCSFSGNDRTRFRDHSNDAYCRWARSRTYARVPKSYLRFFLAT